MSFFSNKIHSSSSSSEDDLSSEEESAYKAKMRARSKALSERTKSIKTLIKTSPKTSNLPTATDLLPRPCFPPTSKKKHPVSTSRKEELSSVVTSLQPDDDFDDDLVAPTARQPVLEKHPPKRSSPLPALEVTGPLEGAAREAEGVRCLDDSLESSSEDEDEDDGGETSSLDFPMSKLLFIFEKVSSQPPSAEILFHGVKLILVNREKIVHAPREAVGQFMAFLGRKEMLEEAMGSVPLSEEYVKALVVLAEAPDFIIPTRFYHQLIDELDLGSYEDFPGLRSILSALALLPPQLSSSTGFSPLAGNRLEFMTMTFALLEMWPGSVPLGSSLFKLLFLAKRDNGSSGAQDYALMKKRVCRAVNITIRALSGDAKGAIIEVKYASRLIGNLLNTSESITRLALMQEVSHLVSSCAEFMAGTKGKNHSAAVEHLLPGQVADWLKHLTLLTHERKDKRLDMVGLLSLVLSDHIAAYSSSPKLAVPALHMVLHVSPLNVAVGIAQDTMASSSNSHVRASTLGVLVETVLQSPREAALGVQNRLWDLILLFMTEDPVEKVRLGVLEAMETVGRMYVVYSNQDQADGASTVGSADEVPTAEMLRTLPPNLLIAVATKCGDVSFKVQARASALLMGADCDGEDGITPAIIGALKSASASTKSEVALILIGLDVAAVRSPENYENSTKTRLRALGQLVELPYSAWPSPRAAKP